MGNFEKLGILVIIVLVVVILVLAVWGMGVPSDPQDSKLLLVGNEAREGKPEVKKVPIEDPKASGTKPDRWLVQPVDGKTEPPPKIDGDSGNGVGGAAGNQPKVDSAPKGKDLVHKVVEGDKLWPLADRYYGNGKYWTVIRDANPGINENSLPVGKSLRIPNPDTVLAKNGSAPRTGTNVAKSSSGQKTYTVRKNDTLSTIAARTMGSSNHWKKLYDANRAAIGSNPDDLRLGMTLVIP